MARAPIIKFTPEGIYCPAGDFYIDPWKPVRHALITHGHADHARFGHDYYLCTDMCAPVMRHRLGDIKIETLPYGEALKIGDATVSFHPAGHVPGSAQIKVEVGGEIWVASGDYKIEDDGFSTPFTPVKCHHFITESTFGLPVFNWQTQQIISYQINDWWATCAQAGQTAFLGAYSLGKAQRLLALLNPDIGPILTHTAIENTNRILRAQDMVLPATILADANLDPKAHKGAIVIAPPSALGSAWAHKFGPQQTGFASGWMQMRGVRRRRAGDRGFVISDHADWGGLLQAIKQTDAENIYVTHGYTDIFARYLNEKGWNAQTVPTQFSGETLEKDAS